MEAYGVIPVFVAVVEQGGFAGAARELGLTRSAVSKRVQALEQRLGVQLLHRTTRKIRLTEAGAHYYEHALKARAAVRDAEDAVSWLQGEPRGRLRVHTPMSFGRLHVAPLIPEFLKRYPELEVDMEMEDRMVNLLEGGFDVGIRSGNLPTSSAIVRKLTPGHSVVCASPEYFERHGRPATPEELTQHNCVLFSFSTEVDTWTFLDAHDTRAIQVSGNYRVNNSEALREALVRGIGIGRLPTFVAGPDLREGRLVACFEGLRMPHKEIYAVIPERRFMPAKVRVFLDFAVEFFGGDKPWWDTW